MPASLTRELKAIEAEKAKLAEREKRLKQRMIEQAENELRKAAKKYGLEDAKELLDQAQKLGHAEAMIRLAGKPSGDANS
ncbi:MAG TPA: hypothetical protein PLI17_13390 [Denitromonas sp.]|nr:hypothetical protein [Denitromonas sp.]